MSIRTELEKTLITWATTQSITVAVENFPFTKPISGSYLEVFFLSSYSINPTTDASRERETGVMQINVCTKQSPAQGVKASEAIAASVKALFPVVPKTGTVSIERPVQQSQGIDREDGFRVIPLSVYYRQER